MVAYIGNGAYCYANSTAMLLASVGATITPSQIEVLTGVGMGALWLPHAQSLFFGNGTPDVGISNALTILGFAFTENVSADGSSLPLDELRAALRHGPVVLGPLDMGELDYNPDHEHLSGVDHYVLAFDMDESDVYLHDPAGFPNVALSFAQLDHAWKAEQIGYRRGAYRYWYAPRRERQPSQAEIYARSLAAFRAIYQGATASVSDAFMTGSAAIRTVATQFRNDMPTPTIVMPLVNFALPVSAKRALDYATFFAPHDERLAALKTQQAALFGRAQTQAMRQRWATLADTLDAIADVEEDIRASICG